MENRTPCEQLLAAVHAALGCPVQDLPGVVAVCRSAIAVALDNGDEVNYPHLIRFVEHGSKPSGS